MIQRLLAPLRPAQKGPPRLTRLEAGEKLSQQAVQELWWLWRHHYLEAKRLQVGTRTRRED
jgi:hypothetical protein